jgi:SAM-dependent methyltransferase
MSVADLDPVAPTPFDHALFVRFLHDYPAQPATALFRTVEIGHLLSTPFPVGYGLDLGCGDGLLTKVVLDRVGPRRVVGLDSDPAETALARWLGIYDQVLTVSGDAIPVPDGTFDWVFSNSVLEHIDGIEGVLHEVSRVLRPTGVFLFTVPGDGFHDCLRGPILPWVSRPAYLAALDARVAHRRYWSPAEWRERLARHRLSVEEVSRYLGARALRRWETIARLTAGVLYLAFGRRKQPIEIQRTLGLRRAGLALPAPLAAGLARVLSAGLQQRLKDGEGTACLRIIARKRAP